MIWQPVYISGNAKIGEDVVIGRFTNICGEVVIGAGTRIQGMCYIPGGVWIGRDVFIGPNVTFTNVRYPKVRTDGSEAEMVATIVKDRACIGANVVILPGIIIGEDALIGAGSVVTRDVGIKAVVYGNPARERG